MGFTFKEDVTDIRNTKVVDVIKELESYGVNVDIVDCYADIDEVKQEYDIDMQKKAGNSYDAIIVAVNHQNYLNLDEDYFKSISSENGILVDVKGIYRGKIKDMDYFSL